MFNYLKNIIGQKQYQQQNWSRQFSNLSFIDFYQEHHRASGFDQQKRYSTVSAHHSEKDDFCTMDHLINDDQGLLINSSASNKRSITNHLVGYMKKSKCLVPCSLVPPSKLADDQATASSSSKLMKKKSVEQHGKRGSICIAYSLISDDHSKSSILTLHVIRARQLSLVHPEHQSLNTFVRVTLSNQYEQTSKIIHASNCPVYDEKFVIPLEEKNFSTPSKRLTISVYHQSISNAKSDLIGCMSFNMKTLLKTSSCVKTSSKCKWYCLLPESIGRHKRMALNVDSNTSQSKRMTHSRRAHSSANPPSNGLLLNVEIYTRDEIEFAAGYPCTVSQVKSGVMSSSNRPMPGDILLQVNEINVSRTQAKAVNKLIRNLPLPITLQLYRRSVPTTSVKLDKIILNSVEQHQPLNCKIYSKSSELKNSFSDAYADRGFCSSDKPYSNYDDMTPCLLPETIILNTKSHHHQDQSLMMSPIQRKNSEHSDGSESGVGSESNPYSDGEHRLKIISESYEREALRLIEIEKEFIAQLELGVQYYSRPLKHYLISTNEHGKLFQNIEKILAISRYQLNRLQSLSTRTIVSHIGQIFHEKVQLICEAFTRYISGYSDACSQLKQLNKCASFQRFITANQSNLTIEQFLRIPLDHIDNLASQLDILCCACEDGNDANYLLHVLKELRQCSSHHESSNAQHHFTTTMTLNSASGMTSSINNSVEDEQILDLQNRLQHSKNTQPIVLTGRNRHIIFSGVLLLQFENKTYVETWAILLNDMLLFTQRNPVDTRLTLLCDPIHLNDIVDFRSSVERPDALIFLSNKPTMPYKIRYPSQCLQCAWQTILEQRLKAWQRSIHDESSSADSDLE